MDSFGKARSTMADDKRVVFFECGFGLSLLQFLCLLGLLLTGTFGLGWLAGAYSR